MPWNKLLAMRRYAALGLVPCWSMHRFQLRNTTLQVLHISTHICPSFPLEFILRINHLFILLSVCSDFKENIRRKERKARMNEKRLRMLRKKEQELKKIYDLQSIESQLAGAAGLFI